MQQSSSIRRRPQSKKQTTSTKLNISRAVVVDTKKKLIYEMHFSNILVSFQNAMDRSTDKGELLQYAMNEWMNEDVPRLPPLGGQPPQDGFWGQQGGGLGRTVTMQISVCRGGQEVAQHMSIFGGCGNEICWGHSSPLGAIGPWEVGHLKLTTIGLGQHLTRN
jgi:hypothetical protein